MKINQSVAQKITINTSVAPAIQQALKMLQMTNLELQDYLEQQSIENPFLIVDPLERSPLGAHHLQNNMALHYEGDEDEGSIIEKTLTKTSSTQQAILSQINITFSDPKDLYLAKIMYGLLDDRGFFTVNVDALAKKIDQSPKKIREILSQLKKMDPPGIFAANWKESVLTQLDEMGKLTPLYKKILAHLDEILHGKVATICKRLRITEIDVYHALKVIKNISPYPLYTTEAAEVVVPKIPDVIVERNGEGWDIELNPETLPKILVDRDYFYSIKSACSTDEEKGFIRGAFHQANWLVNAMDQRCQNILKIVHAVVRRQTMFLEMGEKALQPMTLKDIALEIGVHESTVSRATSHKYIQTPQGTYPLKYFFTQAISGSFQEYSAESIRKQIRQMIENEDKVLSDEKIATMLKHLGVDIARRTVTKYRENLSIPSSSERRRIKKIQRTNKFN